MIKTLATSDTEVIKPKFIFYELVKRLPKSVKLWQNDVIDEIVIGVNGNEDGGGGEAFLISTDMFNASILMYETKHENGSPKPSFEPILTATPTDETNFNELFVNKVIAYLASRYGF